MAGVSTGTVDRVLHKRSGVSETTRRTIEKIIQDHGYEPHMLARNLASNRRFRFLVCMPRSVYAHDFWSAPTEGIDKALRETAHFGIEVEYLVFDQHDKHEFIRKAQSVDPNDYDGLLFAPVFRDESAEMLRHWEESGRACVLFNSRLEGVESLSFIGQDAYQSGYLGARIMSYGMEFGKDLLIVNLSQRKDNYEHIIRREKGFRSWFEDHTGQVNHLVTLDLNGGRKNRLEREMDTLMKTYDFTGIFATNSRVHLVADYLAKKGVMKMRLIGYDLVRESIGFLKREYIDFLISQRPVEQAYKGLKTLFNAVVMEQEVEPLQYMPIDILTRENIDYYER